MIWSDLSDSRSGDQTQCYMLPPRSPANIDPGLPATDASTSRHKARNLCVINVSSIHAENLDLQASSSVSNMNIFYQNCFHYDGIFNPFQDWWYWSHSLVKKACWRIPNCKLWLSWLNVTGLIAITTIWYELCIFHWACTVTWVGDRLVAVSTDRRWQLHCQNTATT